MGLGVREMFIIRTLKSAYGYRLMVTKNSPSVPLREVFLCTLDRIQS